MHFKGGEGFPKVYRFSHTKKNNYAVMTLLGENLEELFEMCQRNFSLKTICMIAVQVVTRLETMHSKASRKKMKENVFG
jgi:serine/threonine protein kinase